MAYDQFRGRMLAPQECADALSNSPATVQRWIRQGRLKATKLSSRCTRIDGDSIAELLSAGAIVPGAKAEQPEALRRQRASHEIPVTDAKAYQADKK